MVEVSPFKTNDVKSLQKDRKEKEQEKGGLKKRSDIFNVYALYCFIHITQILGKFGGGDGKGRKG